MNNTYEITKNIFVSNKIKKKKKDYSMSNNHIRLII